jgi:hypothetical protein
MNLEIIPTGELFDFLVEFKNEQDSLVHAALQASTLVLVQVSFGTGRGRVHVRWPNVRSGRIAD